jgi:hypothetical protein
MICITQSNYFFKFNKRDNQKVSLSQTNIFLFEETFLWVYVCLLQCHDITEMESKKIDLHLDVNFTRATSQETFDCMADFLTPAYKRLEFPLR